MTGRKINSFFVLTDDDPSSMHKTAIIELADASGLKLLQRDEYDPLHATTFGTGELIKYALETGVRKIILCIGGSATVDGGIGIVQALGAVFYDEKGNILVTQ
jgi:glycerate kinase